MYRDRRRDIILGLKKQVWRERRLFLLVVGLLCALVLYQRLTGGFYALRVNGVAVVWASSRENADDIVNKVKEKQGGKIPPSVSTEFAEKLKIRREKFTGEEIPDTEEAVDKLMPVLSLLIRGPVITVDGRAVVGVPSREIGDLVLTEVKRRLGPPAASGEVVDADFQEKVEVKEGVVPVRMFSEKTDAAAALLSGKSDSGTPGKPALTLISVTNEMERGSAGTEGAPARMMKVTYANGKEIGREPLE